jgi:hypothetical protein
MPPAARHIPRGPGLLHLRRLIFLSTQEIRHLGCGFLHVDTVRSCAVIAVLFGGSLGQRPELNHLYTHVTGHPSLNHALRFGVMRAECDCSFRRKARDREGALALMLYAMLWSSTSTSEHQTAPPS